MGQGFNASWSYAAPTRPQPASAASYSQRTAGPPPSADTRVVPPILVGGPAPARSFGEAITVCLSKYATFKGRASRSEYWYFALFYFLAVFASTFLAISLLPPGAADLVGVVVQLALVLPSISVGVRRMHDLDLDGWFVLVPLYNFVLLASRGTDGPNSFG